MSIVSNNTTYYEDLENIPDSLLMESDTVIAEYHNDETNIHLSLQVCGEVKIEYKDSIYEGASEFPQELTDLIRNGYYDEEGMHHSFEDNPDVYVCNNNWFELFAEDEKGNKTHESWVCDCENYTAADIDSLFMDTEEEILEKRKELEVEAQER